MANYSYPAFQGNPERDIAFARVNSTPTSTPQFNGGSNFGNSVFGTALDIGSSAVSSYIQGSISDRFNQKAEKRADERTRRLLVDQPGLTAEGRRRAGLNPYGDATLPGASAQSTTDTSPAPNLGKSTQNMLAGQQLSIAEQQLALDTQIRTQSSKNETLVAESTANKNNAEAERLRGQETRDDKRFPSDLRLLIANAVGQEKANTYQDIVNYIADNTKEDRILSSHYDLSELKDALGTNKQILANLRKDGKIKDAVYQKTLEEKKLLEGQIFAQEIKNTLGVRQFTYLTGIDYYTQEKVGDGLWQLEYDTADARARAEDYNARMLKERFEQYDVELILDRLLDSFEILDIINDDVFDWMERSDKEKFQKELLEFKKRDKKDRRNAQSMEFSLTLLVRLLPYILNKLG